MVGTVAVERGKGYAHALRPPLDLRIVSGSQLRCAARRGWAVAWASAYVAAMTFDLQLCYAYLHSWRQLMQDGLITGSFALKLMAVFHGCIYSSARGVLSSQQGSSF